MEEFFGEPEKGNLRNEIKAVNSEIAKINTVDENVENGKKAIKNILKNHKDVSKAMYRDEVGYIDFLYGEEGTAKKDRSDGYGLAKILKKHGRGAVDKISEVIAKGKYEKSKYGDRGYFLLDGYRAVVRFTWDGKKKTWLVTNFFDKKIRTLTVQMPSYVLHLLLMVRFLHQSRILLWIVYHRAKKISIPL